MGLPQSKPQLPAPAQENPLSKLFVQSYAQPVLAALTLFDLRQLARTSKLLAKSHHIAREKSQKILQALVNFLLHPVVQEQDDCPAQKTVQVILDQKVNLPIKIERLLKLIKKPVNICVFEVQQRIYIEEIIAYESQITLVPDSGFIPAWSEQQSMFKSVMARQLLLTELHPLQFILDCPILFRYINNQKYLKKLHNIRRAFQLRAAAENNNFMAVELLLREGVDLNFASKNARGNFPATDVREPDGGEFPDAGCPLVGAIINNHKTMVLWLLDKGVYVSATKKHLLLIVFRDKFLFNQLPRHIVTSHLLDRESTWHAETIQQIAGLEAFQQALFQVIQVQARVHRLQLWQAIKDPNHRALISKLFYVQLRSYVLPNQSAAVLKKITTAYKMDVNSDSIEDQRRAIALTNFFPQFNVSKCYSNPNEILLAYCGLPQVKFGMQL